MDFLVCLLLIIHWVKLPTSGPSSREFQSLFPKMLEILPESESDGRFPRKRRETPGKTIK